VRREKRVRSPFSETTQDWFSHTLHTPRTTHHAPLTTTLFSPWPYPAKKNSVAAHAPEANMDRMAKPWLDLWDYLDRRFWAVWNWSAGQLRPDEVRWQPLPQVASFGWNLEHLAEMLDLYLSRYFRCQAQVRPGTLRTMQHDMPDDGRFDDLQAIGAYHRQVRRAYRQLLIGLTDSDFDRNLEPAGRAPVSVGWAVGHIAEHESYHLGKFTLLRTLLMQRRVPMKGDGQ
jgi:hypothetical protein